MKHLFAITLFIACAAQAGARVPVNCVGDYPTVKAELVKGDVLQVQFDGKKPSSAVARALVQKCMEEVAKGKPNKDVLGTAWYKEDQLDPFNRKVLVYTINDKKIALHPGL